MSAPPKQSMTCLGNKVNIEAVDDLCLYWIIGRGQAAYCNILLTSDKSSPNFIIQASFKTAIIWYQSLVKWGNPLCTYTSYAIEKKSIMKNNYISIQSNRPSQFQIKARLSGAKPLFEPIKPYMKFYVKFRGLHWRKCTWKCCLQIFFLSPNAFMSWHIKSLATPLFVQHH